MLKQIFGNYSKPKWVRSQPRKAGKRTYAPVSANKKLLILTYLASFALMSVILGTLFMMGAFIYFSKDLPNPNRLLERSDELSTKLYDRTGQPIFEVYGEKNRSLITFDEISPDLINATLAVEDANFYNHSGFYFLGMVRAVRNTLTGQGLQGGSTLTQQVVKNAVLTHDRTVTRKVKELSLALQLENKYTKDQIIQMYLNETPYGGQNYGALTAAKAYFNKHPKDLTVAEAAYLAGLPQSPSRYSYFGSNPDAGLSRKDYVLLLMYEKGWVGPDGKRYYLSAEEYETAKAEELAFQRGQVHFQAPHFVFYVKDILSEMFGVDMVEQGGLEVTTSLDLDFQLKAQEIVADEVGRSRYLNVGNGALVALEPETGQILAMVGSKGYFLPSEPEGCVRCAFDPNVNVTTSLRQPGSSIKPLTYATMLSQGYSTAYPFLDVQTSFPGSAPNKPYIPVNYDGIYRGPVSLRRALGNSLNIPAVKALRIVGIDNMIDQAEKMGVSTLKDRSRFGLALTLGGGETKLLEMTGAFAVFANNGVYVTPNPIIEVKDSQGKVLYKAKSVEKRALSEEVAFLISDILSDDGARSAVFGANSLLNIPGHQVAVKTGTTDDLRDNYAMGYTNEVAIGVWVGNNDNTPMSRVASGITGATPVWNRAMVSFLSGKSASKFEAPSGVKKVDVDSLTGMLPVSDFASRSEWFVNGTAPTAQSEWYVRLEICRPDGLLANDACKEADETRIRTFVNVRAEFPEWQVYVDKWIAENYNDKPEFFPPTTYSALKLGKNGKLEQDGDPVVQFAKLKNGDTVPLEFRLEVEVSSPNSIDRVSIYQDGKTITHDGSFPYGYNFTFKAEEAGEYLFTAIAEDKKGNKGESEIRLRVVGY
jgi:membrane peptidoglycan carboxypeptidase